MVLERKKYGHGSLTGPEIKNDYAGESQQQITSLLTKEQVDFVSVYCVYSMKCTKRFMIDYICVLFVGDGVKRRPRRIIR
jgi:hypothetical protein